MPALPPYIPNPDAKFNNWVNNFSTLITASPATYGLSSGDASTIAGAVATWNAAYALVTSPSTKTAMAVSDKNTARVTTLGIVRPYAQNISLNAGVASADKIAVGVNPRTSTPSPISPPASSPVLTVQSGQNLAVILRYRDSAASPSVKSKPYGVSRLQLSYGTATVPPTDPSVLTSVLSPTKSPFVVQFTAADAGKQAYFAARWVTRTGLFSPWSPIVNFTVPVGA